MPHLCSARAGSSKPSPPWLLIWMTRQKMPRFVRRRRGPSDALVQTLRSSPSTGMPLIPSPLSEPRSAVPSITCNHRQNRRAGPEGSMLPPARPGNLNPIDATLDQVGAVPDGGE